MNKERKVKIFTVMTAILLMEAPLATYMKIVFHFFENKNQPVGDL